MAEKTKYAVVASELMPLSTESHLSEPPIKSMTNPCTCYLEPDFMAGDDDDGNPLVVVDAECVIMAHCPNEESAALIAHALNSMVDRELRCCVVHSGPPRG